MNVLRNTNALIRFGAVLTALWAATARAGEITDDGKFFSAGAIRSASEKIQDLGQRYDYRIKVETIASLPAGEVEDVRKMSAGDRAKFFGHYLAKRAAAEKLDLLIFASRDPKYLQVLPHKKLESAGFTTAMRDKMAAALIADFHAEKFDEGLAAALTQLEQDFTTIHRKAAAPAQSRPEQRRPAQNHPVEGHSAQQPVPFEHPAARQPAEGGWFGPIMLVVLFVGGFLLIRRLIGGAGGGSGGGNNMAGGGGGGGGFMSNILGGVFGAVAGNWLYDSFLRPTAHGQEFDHPRSEGGWGGSGSDSNSNTDDYSADSYDTSGGGGDFDGGGDSGGGGDFGGGDSGGGDGGGGDF